MRSYEPKVIEPKWQARWREADLFRTRQEAGRPKCYILDFFPYPSGDGLSVGHYRNYIPTDVLARFMYMRGYNVLHPMGWDAFGQPAENEAITKRLHPRETVPQYAANYKRQLNLVGTSYDWTREINSSTPEYYKWTQWHFLLLYKRGLAYRKEAPVNWCPTCKTVLANEEVEGGKCWRCGSWVGKRNLKQWFFRITAYADRLLEDLEELDWPEGIKMMQRNWIGRSEGVEFDMPIQAQPGKVMRVFTTRIDTVFGVTFAVLAPEHPLVSEITPPEQRAAVEAYCEATQRLDEATRLSTERERTGVFTGAYAVNPVNGEAVPVFVADYVLMTYGTGAIMAVPGHDERDFDFAKRYNLPIRVVIAPPNWNGEPLEQAYTEDGLMVNSGEFSGIPNREGMERIADWMEAKGIGERKVNYRLRDWLISRQRYWGAPIPIVYCSACGEVPVPEEQLPVRLPEVDQYQPTGTGKSPLAAIPEFVHTSCPRCGSEAERETDTLGGFACSSWYFLRFADPHNDREPYSREAVAYWLPVDYYVGGAEHAVGHLLYARFWTKVLYDAGYLPFKEPFNRLRNQGMVLALTPYRKPEPGEILKPGEPGILIRREELSKYKKEELIWVWEKMSKSKGNVVTPDEVVERYSADTLRLYELFVAPFEADIQWEEQGVRGIYRFLNRLWKLFMDFRPHFVRNWREILANTHELSKDARNLRRRTHTTIKRMYTDIEAFRFNTAVAAMMEWSNEMAAFMSKLQTPPAQRTEVAVLSEAAENLILVLAPFAPHIADELWERYGFEGFTYEQPYPAYEESVAKAEEITLVVQINGKVRDRLTVPADISEEEMKASALASPRVQAYLDGKQVKRIIVVPGKLVNIVI